ncbi:hypothetical protein SAMN02746073_2800 [Legionella jamestowniensis DSM 19215]|uniref:Uncharacterized protein n=2 Tax=Legionella jamestowniensis TaxID=455 RepID=A0A0W0UH04_9GAMM|nr:hypothetical protein Ljam_1384 [Legionella jamestowniensis]SFL96072.1 hypothetical protein SAMN02746073_2800 [Legionella jamestowniensis DSM 19215]
MIKIIILIFAFFYNFTLHASDNVTCPSNLTCDNDTHTCDMPSGWVLDTRSAFEDFSYQNTILAKVISYKTADKQPTIDLRCYYSYGEYSVISIYTYVKALTGVNWEFSSSGKKAECSDLTDSSTCAGINQLNNTIAHKTHLQEMYDAIALTESSSCNNACKKMTIKVRGNSAHFYCLHKQDAPSGWGWVEDGNSQQALPLCECHPVSRPEKRYYVYCA